MTTIDLEQLLLPVTLSFTSCSLSSYNMPGPRPGSRACSLSYHLFIQLSKLAPGAPGEKQTAPASSPGSAATSVSEQSYEEQLRHPQAFS